MASGIGITTSVRGRMRLSSYLKHLRLPFQLVLAPLFLWGFLLAGGEADTGFLVALASLHLCLYPGITAFNSAYDRDEGPVGSMLQPPPVPPGLLAFALALQAAGAVLAAAVGAAFFAVYAAIAAWAAAYSHPLTRWKARPWLSAAAVALGQGALGFLAGWTAAAGIAGIASDRVLLGALGTSLATLGLYPATQVFQIDEDERRGDRTIAVALGPAAALRLGAAALAAAGAVTALLAARVFGGFDGALVGAAFAVVVAMAAQLSAAIARERLPAEQVYRRAMRLLNAAASAFLLFILYRAVAA